MDCVNRGDSMDKEKKKQINDAIAVLRTMCNEHICVYCPFFAWNCDGCENYCNLPKDWEDIA